MPARNALRSHVRIPLRSVAPSAWLLVLMTACGGESPTSPVGSEPPVGPEPPQSVECGGEGYPCSLADVSLDVLERSDALGDSVVDMILNGASVAEATTWIESRPGMVEVQSDDTAIRFRLEGGRGTWIMIEGDELDGDAASGASVDPAKRASSGAARTPDAGPLGSAEGPARTVVREGREQKRALVLSPFLWQMGVYDDGRAVSDILKGTRGYEGGVDYRANETALSKKVGVESFEEWGNYDVVHVSSHGRRLCDEAGCRAMLVATTLQAILAGGTESAAEKTKTLEQEGLDVSKSTHHPGLTFVAATAKFFRKAYPTGLHDTVVFLNACQIFGTEAPDVVDAIQGTGSVVFGWDEAVHAAEAKQTAVALYTDLSERGYPTEVAYDRLGDLRTRSATKYGPPPTLIRGGRSSGGDLRIREIVTLLDPASTLQMTPSSYVLIEGTQNDGEPDDAPWLVRVDGLKPDAAAHATLHVTVDGIAADPVPVASGTADEKDQWTVQGVTPLSYDLEADKAVTFEAWVELPDEGESRQRSGATLSGDEPLMGREWEFVSTETVDEYAPHTTPYSATAHLTLTFAKGQDPKEPHPRYVITGGTVTVDYSHTYYNCTLNGSTTFDVTDEMTGVSELIFDTTLSPVGYSGILYTNGPEFEVQQDCESSGSSTWTNNANNSWMEWTAGDGQTVSTDRKTISGKECVGCDEHFIRESTYTITRVR